MPHSLFSFLVEADSVTVDGEDDVVLLAFVVKDLCAVTVDGR